MKREETLRVLQSFGLMPEQAEKAMQAMEGMDIYNLRGLFGPLGPVELTGFYKPGVTCKPTPEGYEPVTFESLYRPLFGFNMPLEFVPEHHKGVVAAHPVIKSEQTPLRTVTYTVEVTYSLSSGIPVVQRWRETHEL